MAFDRRNESRWRYAVALAGLASAVTVAARAPNSTEGRTKGQPGRHQVIASTSSIASHLANAEASPSQDCVDKEQHTRSCNILAMQAAIDQAGYAYWQTLIGLAGVAGVVISLIFSARANSAASKAATEAEKGARASQETLEETKRMNAVVVRPIVAVESASIAIDLTDFQPKITLVTRNASDYTAHDWEWQPQLKYRVEGSERKSSLMPWGIRGIRGINLPPGDERNQIPVTVSLALNLAEQVAITESDVSKGLHIFLTVFSRCYDAFGNPVDDVHHFGGTAFYLFGRIALSGGDGDIPIPLQAVPPGAHIEGQEDKIPKTPTA